MKLLPHVGLDQFPLIPNRSEPNKKGYRLILKVGSWTQDLQTGVIFVQLVDSVLCASTYFIEVFSHKVSNIYFIMLRRPCLFFKKDIRTRKPYLVLIIWYCLDTTCLKWPTAFQSVKTEAHNNYGVEIQDTLMEDGSEFNRDSITFWCRPG